MLSLLRRSVPLPLVYVAIGITIITAIGASYETLVRSGGICSQDVDFTGTIAVGGQSVTATRITNWQTAYSHSSNLANPHATTAAQIGADSIVTEINDNATIELSVDAIDLPLSEGSAHGQVATWNATTGKWEGLAHGTSGQVLSSRGADTMPTWSTSVNPVTATSPLTGGVITTTGTIGIQAASDIANGYLSADNHSRISSLYSVLGGASSDSVSHWQSAYTHSTATGNPHFLTSDDLGGENIIGSINAATSGKIDSARLDVVGLGLGDLLAVNNLSDLDSAVAAKANLSLNNVENTALSTWAGSTNITTLGTVATGTWSGSIIPVLKGGTGASTAANARTNLGLGNVENTALSTWGGSTSITQTGHLSDLLVLDTFRAGNIASSYWNFCVFDAFNKVRVGGGDISDIPADQVELAGNTTATMDFRAGHLSGDIVALFVDDSEQKVRIGGYDSTVTPTATCEVIGNLSVSTSIDTGTWNATAIGISKGGTGSTTAQDARTALLPSQGGAFGMVLTSDGVDVEWAFPAGGGHTIRDSLDSEYTQRGHLKFSDSFSVTDNEGNDATEIALVDTATTYDSDFVNGNLSAGVLTLTHSLGKKFVSVIITNNSDEQIIPDKITYSSTSACAIDLSGFGSLTGTWHAFANTGGTSVSSGGGGEWTLVERQTISGSATNSVTFSSLDGNTDLRYKLIYVVVAGETSGSAWGARPNNDSGANYSYSQTYANGGSAAASNGTANTLLYAGSNNTSSGMAMSEQIINATSGVYRMGLSRSITQTSATAVNYADTTGHMWRNSADNITSIVCSGPSNCYGVGTVIELWKLAE